ncbi:ExeM/NucH family extracellular endonuclease [Salipiger bermudensis]|uniref:ExeM/NucH family extracellular endonuclease n=1 Tax=Salipiger bermudensis TaxID=344736 RepID=UPI001C9967A4|nr:ExeM/NucH family extracellular endonuclease [Salipiger bermudensis]MBY6002837.1 ExeM/NucH family extracellular endonuclease [Salipiger bermudensis]
MFHNAPFGKAFGRQFQNPFNFEFGSRRGDQLSGTAGTDFIFGRAGDDTVTASDGLDFIDGGRGFDMVIYEGSILDADIALSGLRKGRHHGLNASTAIVTLTDAQGDVSSIDVLKKVEALHFAADDYTLFLDGTNNAVLAGDDSATTTETEALTLAEADLLANDSEFDGDSIAITSVDATSALGASVTFANGEIVYTPAFDALAEGEILEDSFTYTVDDGYGGTDMATVTVTVTGSNDAPVLTVSDAAITIDENTTAVTTVSAGDVDNGASLAYSLEGDDAALFEISEDGTIRFVAGPDYEAPSDADGDNSYALTVVVTDEFGARDARAITVSVRDLWDPITLTQGFETESGGGKYDYDPADGALTELGEIVDLPNVPGLATVDSTAASAGLWGYDLEWENTRNDTGIADSDWIGIQRFTGDVGSFSEGEQGYELSDADGLLRLTFDPVDLSARADNTVVKVALDLFLIDTGWEPDDLVRIFVETDLGTFTLLDTTGLNIDDLAIEGAWQTLQTTLPAEVSSASLIVELDSNATAEALYLDNIKLQEVFQLTQSFETEATGSQYALADASDGETAFGEEAEVPNIPGLATVDSTAASEGLLGFDLTWVNTRAAEGLSDGDFIGVQSFTGAVGAFSDGVQGYELSDADGLLRLSFDTLDLTAVGELTFSIDAFLQSTGYESDDLVKIYIQTDQGEVALLDSTGMDIDDLGIEGSWMTLSATVGAEVTSAQLIAEFDSNAASEALYLDNVVITSDPEAVVPPPVSEITLISEIQGAGDATDMEGQQVTASAIVTALTDEGFWLQEEDLDSDGNALTSEGIYVFTDGGYAVSLGDLVEVTGTVTEYFGLTEITSVSGVVVQSSGNPLPTATVVALSPDTAPDWETLEGMRLEVVSGTTDALTITENYNLARYGQIAVAAGAQVQPTQIYDAQTEQAEIAALSEANANAALLLDDGVSSQNPDAFEYLPDNNPLDDNDYLDLADDFGDTGTTVRLGSEIAQPIEGVLGYSFGEWALQVTETLVIDDSANPREAAPADVGGSLQVASYNVLNFFTTIDEGSNATGPNGDLDPRGADTAAEFERQAAKIVDGIIGTGAEVLALQEIENNGTTAIGTLVDLLNAEGTGASYAYVDPTGSGDFIGTDAITTGIVYDANAVTLLHSEYLVYEEPSATATAAIGTALTDIIGGSFDDYDRNRPSVAATFLDNDTGTAFTVVSSHFKSKGSSGLDTLANRAETWLASNAGDPDYATVEGLLADLYADPNYDQGDGQGFWNGARLDGAIELSEWIETEYNGGGTSNYVLLGDMNSYAEEDAVQYLDDDAGLVDLIDEFIPGGQDEAYSYVFDGQRGTLDQGLADDALAASVTGVTEWHINADEPSLINYDTSFVDPAFYNDGVYASSDHDPLIVGLEFGIA